jgi:hypothetical protein
MYNTIIQAETLILEKYSDLIHNIIRHHGLTPLNDIYADAFQAGSLAVILQYRKNPNVTSTHYYVVIRKAVQNTISKYSASISYKSYQTYCKYNKGKNYYIDNYISTVIATKEEHEEDPAILKAREHLDSLSKLDMDILSTKLSRGDKIGKYKKLQEKYPNDIPKHNSNHSTYIYFSLRCKKISNI